MYCSNCGIQIPEGSKFCPECGVRLSPLVDFNQNEYEENGNKADYYEDDRYEAAETRRGSSRNVVKKKPKRRRLLKFLIVILCLIAAFLLYDSRELYIYSTFTVRSTEKLTKKDHQDFKELFEGRYLLFKDGEYTAFDPLTGLGFTDTSVKEFEEDIGQFEFSTSGNYAYIEISFSSSNDRILVSFVKPTLKERIYFISKYYSWT